MGGDFLRDPIQFIKGVGPVRAKQFQRLGIVSLEDALLYLPFRYEDRSALKKIVHLSSDQIATVCGNVVSAEVIVPRRKHFKIFELTVSDGSGIIKAKWYNQPFMKKVFKIGQQIFLSGNIRTNPYYGTGYEMENPEYEFVDDGKDQFIHTARIVPVYRTVSGLGQKTLRSAMYHIVHYAVPKLQEYIPEELVERNGLVAYTDAVQNIHFPEGNGVDVDALNQGKSGYHRRLIFDELFCFHLGVAQVRKGVSEKQGIGFSAAPHLTELLKRSLPFTFTNSQNKVIEEIFSDMAEPHPMNRLIQGDVGSGKTVVALMAMLRAVECGYQAALMAPTELLAQQHYANIRNLLDGMDVNCALYTSKTREQKSRPDLVIGTHALIQDDILFDHLGLAVIDEQHRFGVRQRALLKGKGVNPDVLIMTATPIPRTLALTLYGDMDYSCIDELPPGRTPVETCIVSESEKRKVYDLIQREIVSGGQVYVVYPVIEEDSSLDLRSAELGKEKLKEIFPSYRVELVHGRMNPDGRQQVMLEFRSGDIQILVSTTVIEVGVDVPNANVMIIVHAERFGLSQLHQLRGRVGRGRRKSYCVLLAYGVPGDDAKRRLAVMEKTTDGFQIAEEDLGIRGPGDFFGTKQSGMPDLKVANIIRDRSVVETTRREACGLLNLSPHLDQYPLLRERVNRMWKTKLTYFNTY
ncbi:MAG: ATP-dependent DNA helicase RecG [bacterium]